MLTMLLPAPRPMRTTPTPMMKTFRTLFPSPPLRSMRAGRMMALMVPARLPARLPMRVLFYREK